jgi:hypothetical protein
MLHLQVWGKSAGRRELTLKCRCPEVLYRTQKIMVGRDGIEPPTPGFSVLDLNRRHLSPSQLVAISKAHGRSSAANSVVLRDVGDNLGDRCLSWI